MRRNLPGKGKDQENNQQQPLLNARDDVIAIPVFSSDGRRGLTCSPMNIKRALDVLSSDLLSGDCDRRLIASVQSLRSTRDVWIAFPLSPVCRQGEPINDGALVEMNYPSWDIMELLSRLGLEEQLFRYLFRFARSISEGMARAFESLQASIFDGGLNYYLENREGFRAGQNLNLFRLAQKIRDENGLVRMSSIRDCFQSFEDIAESETKLKRNDAVDLMAQCTALKLVDQRHLATMYGHTYTLSQLGALHDILIRCGDRSWNDEITKFRGQFGYLTKDRKESPLGWRHVKIFLKSTGIVTLHDELLFGENILESELDEFLHCGSSAFYVWLLVHLADYILLV